MKTVGPIRVMILDESPLAGGRLAHFLRQDSGIHVVGQALDACQARALILDHQPNVVLLDLGSRASLAVLGSLKMYYPVPVIAYTSRNATPGQRAMRALELGVLDLLAKPDLRDHAVASAFAGELLTRIRVAAADARPMQRASRTIAGWRAQGFAQNGVDPAEFLIVIGASTGGPEALRALLSRAPADFPPVVIVQHMPATFTASFANRLAQSSPLVVHEAQDHEFVGPGQAVVARGDTHLTVRRTPQGFRVCYTDQQPVNRHCPSVDVLFDSAVSLGPAAVGVLLTGMGDDGARGLLRLSQAGALTIAQDHSSCVVYGMPKAAVQLGAAARSAKPEEIPDLIRQELAKRMPLRATR